VLDPIFILPIGTSAVTLGLGYILALGAPLFGVLDFDLRASRLLMPLAHTLIALPFVVRSLLPVLRQMDPHLREIAASLGASPVQTFLRVDVPILRRGMAIAAVFAFTVSMGEFGATLLISRPDFPTVSMVIYRYLSHPGATNYATALAMSVILLIASAIGFILIERLRVGNAEF
jgi:thiamine transport system permease protein